MIIYETKSALYNRISRIISTVEQHAFAIVLFAMVFYFLAGLAYSLILGDSLRYQDEKVYYSFAENLRSTGMYSSNGTQPSAEKAPGYGFLLYVISLASNSILAMRLFNFLALSLSLLLLYKLLAKHSRPFIGFLGILLCVCYPVLFYTASTLYPQTIGTTILLLILYLADRKPKLSPFPSILIGFLAGYLILTIPTFIFLIAIFLAWKLFIERDRLIMIFLLIFGILLVSVPWEIRNYRVFNTFVFITTDGGINLLLGNNPNTTPNAGVNTDISQYRDFAAANGMEAAQTDRYFRDQAIQWILDNKVDALRLYIGKFVNYFNVANELQTAAESSSLRNTIMGITYLPLLLIFLINLVPLTIFKKGKFEWQLITFYIAWGLIMAVFFTRIRYRLPLDFLLIAVDSLFIYHVSNYLRSKRKAFSK